MFILCLYAYHVREILFKNVADFRAWVPDSTLNIAYDFIYISNLMKITVNRSAKIVLDAKDTELY